MSHFVNDHANQAELGAVAVGAVLIRARAVEANHRVFHAAHRAVDANRHRVGVRDRVLGKNVEGMGHRVGGIAAPKGLAFRGEIGHGPNPARALHIHSEGIPSKASGRGPGKVPHVLGVELPGLGASGLALGALSGFLGSHDQGRLIRFPSAGQSFAPDGLQNLVGVLQLTGGSNHVIVRHGDVHLVVAEFQGELSAAHKLFVLPACVVRVGAQARKPLGDFIETCAIGELLVPRACAQSLGMIDQVGPADVEACARTADQGLGKIHPHHGVVDRVGQILTRAIGDANDCAGPIEIQLVQDRVHLAIGHAG